MINTQAFHHSTNMFRSIKIYQQITLQVQYIYLARQFDDFGQVTKTYHV